MEERERHQVAVRRAHARDHAAGVAGAVFLSGIYDVRTSAVNTFNKAYYGDDVAGFRPLSFLTTLAGGLTLTDIEVVAVAVDGLPADDMTALVQLR